MTQTMTFTAREVKKEGTGKNGKPYVIYSYTDIIGKKYDSFDDLPLNQEVKVEEKIPDNPTWPSSVSLPRQNNVGNRGGVSDDHIRQLAREEIQSYIKSKNGQPTDDLPF